MIDNPECLKPDRRFESFPEEWGLPRGSQGSAERAAWVRKKVIEHGRLTPHQQAEIRLARLSARLRLAELDEKRKSP